MTEQSEPSLGDVLAALQSVSERLYRLEGELHQLRSMTEVPEDVVIAISAAVAATLGHRTKVKQVHYRTGAAWAQQGRAVVQGRHGLPHGTR